MTPIDATTRGPTTAALVQACRWIELHLGDFRLARWMGSSDDAFWASIKAIAELAHAGDFLARAPGAEQRSLGAAWIDLAWDEVEHGATIRNVIAADPRFLPVVLTYVPFHLIGRRSAEVSDAIARQAPRATLGPIEWSLVAPVLEILDVPVPAAATTAAREHSVLTRRPPVDTMAPDAAYILAHECFYASRWGHEPARYADANARDYVHETLAALMERATRAGDADLLAELILAALVTRTDVDARALEVVERAQTPTGNVVPPPRLLTRHQRFVHPTMPRTYHTTLAAIMAWARWELAP